MAGLPLPQHEVTRRLEALEATKNEDGTYNQMRAAKAIGISRTTLQNFVGHVDSGKYKKDEMVHYPDFVLSGDDEEPIDDILKRFKKAGALAKKAIEARNWFTINVKETKPYAILWFGDPHLGPHCDWDLLERDVAIANLPGVYAGNIGDTTDNWPWTGRMARLWAENDISKKTERRLATWFMHEAGIKWLLWLGGNHDEWNGGSDFYKMIGAQEIPVIDWRARFKLVHKNGVEVKIDAAHGRKGTSIYNPTHGTLRDAKFGEDADLFVTGHIHSYGLFDIEFPEKRHRTWLAQISGYKTGDHYALVNGYSESRHGASMLSVIDPATGKVQCFGDPELGASYLAFMRSR